VSPYKIYSPLQLGTHDFCTRLCVCVCVCVCARARARVRASACAHTHALTHTEKTNLEYYFLFQWIFKCKWRTTLWCNKWRIPDNKTWIV